FVEALEASHPGYIVRLLGGGTFVLGMFLMAYNAWRTVRSADRVEIEFAVVRAA
ncbi:MAG TPA: cytochrome C oxidase Cbb3, partial [Pseudomonas sp.]|nr:cytochrome C oxidase Cbb3 [Pseudomonas sp.]